MTTAYQGVHRAVLATPANEWSEGDGLMDDGGMWNHYFRLHMLSRSYTPRMIHIVDGLLAHVVSILHAANDSYC